MHIFDLISVYVRHGMRYGDGEIYDNLVIRSRLPYFQNLITYFGCEFWLCAGNALRRIFEGDIPLSICLILFAKLCSKGSNIYDLLLASSEHLLALRYGRGVVKMNHRMLCTSNRLEGFRNYMLP